ncbi:hypothetical protein, partial [Blautia massiliensis (ex Durand et al. 2017)]|uniref:hypothetical protein n=1 Tax=Blautia massiliensis (ex Durand et al. 2017) TaxID=1737424 RepID=UPI0022E498A1
DRFLISSALGTTCGSPACEKFRLYGDILSLIGSQFSRSDAIPADPTAPHGFPSAGITLYCRYSSQGKVVM